MGVTFPTRPPRNGGGPAPAPGEPRRASHCHCDAGSVIFAGQDTCQTCGHYTRSTIAQTWQLQAARHANGNAR